LASAELGGADAGARARAAAAAYRQAEEQRKQIEAAQQ
jgi:hypothetical protein